MPKRPGRVVGFDFQDNSVRVVQMAKKGREIALERVAFLPVEPEVWRMGRIGDADAFLERLREGLIEAEIGGRKAVVGLSGTNSVVRVVRLPKMKPSQLRETLNVQLGQYVPFPPEDTLFKYEVIGEVVEDEIEKFEIMILATRYSIIEPILLAVQKLGMDPVGVKIGFLSAGGILSRYYEDFSQSVAVVDLRNAITDILFVTSQTDDLMEEEAAPRRKKKAKKQVGAPARLARTIEFGYERIMRDLAKELEVDVADLPQILRTVEVDLLEAGDASAPEERPPEDPFAAFASDEEDEEGVEEEAQGPTSAQVNQVLRRIFTEFANEIDKSKRYFESSSKRRERLGRIVLVGNVSRFANLEAFLTERSGLDVVMGDPMGAIWAAGASAEWHPEEMRGRSGEVTTPVALAREAWHAKELARFNLLPREFSVKKTSIATMKWVALLAIAGVAYGMVQINQLEAEISSREQEKAGVEREQTQSRQWNMPVLQTVCDSLGGTWDGDETADPPEVGECSRQYAYKTDAERHDNEQGHFNTVRPKLGAVAMLSASQFPWEHFLDEIRTVIPKTVWLSQRAGDANNLVGIAVEEMERVTLVGQALTEEDIYKFARRLRDSRFFVDPIELDFSLAVGDEEVAGRQQQRPGGGLIDELKSYFDVEEQTLLLYNFTISLTLNPDLNSREELMNSMPPVLSSLFGGGGGGGGSRGGGGGPAGALAPGGGLGGGGGAGLRPPGG